MTLVRRALMGLALLASVTPGSASAQATAAAHPVRWSARASARSVAPGDTVRVTLRASIEEFFHLYSTTQGPGGPVRTTVELLPNAAWMMRGALRVPSPDTIPDGNFGIMSEVYDDSVSIGLTLKAMARGGAAPRLAVTYQACTTRYCLPPRTDTVAVFVSAAAASTSSDSGGANAATTAASTSVASRDSAARASEQASTAADVDIVSFGGAGGIGAFLLLAASMGALALLTPCVFPMIPITVTSFLTTSDDGARGVARAGMYALGIVASFTGLGVITAALFGAAGLARFSANPIVNLAIAALFTVFALSLLGVIRFAMPSGLVQRMASARIGGSAAGPLFMGVVFTLTAFTCTAPFIGTLLVMSSQGSWGWPLVGMIVFSTVFAAPFFALALVPGLLRRRPRAGDWMPSLEIVVGAVEIAAAVKFASNADLVLGWGMLTRRVVVGIWIAIFFALIVTLLRRRRTMSAESPPRSGRFHFAASAVSLALIALLVPGLFDRRLGELDAFLPPLLAAEANGSTGGELKWLLNDYRAALLTASREQRPILVDFTGYTCTNCRWMESNMFPREDVKRKLDRFVRVRLYTDGLGEPYRSQQLFEQRTFGTVALPLYAVLDPTGRPRVTFLGMTRDAAEFNAFLDRGLVP